MSLRDSVMKQPKTVEVEAFGKTVTLQEIGALDRIAYLEYLQKLQADGVSDQRAGLLLQAFMLVKCAIEDGKRVFEDSEIDAIAASNIDLADMGKVFTAATKLNGLAGEEGN